MTTDLHPELAALLSAVHSEPDCDVVRLAVADWLDEHTQSERVKCPTCLTVEASGYAQTDFLSHATGQCYKCESPNGTVGTILRQSSDGTRAEFIRVQVELAKFREPIVCDESPTTVSFNPDYPFEKWESLFAREDAILAQWGDVWRRGEECRECEGHGCLLGCAGDKRNPTCDRCQGTGDAGGLMERFDYEFYREPGHVSTRIEPVRITYSRGLAVVTVPTLEDCVHQMYMDCPQCGGNGDNTCSRCHGHTRVSGEYVPTPWLRAVAANPWVEQVRVAEASPGRIFGESGKVTEWYWFRNGVEFANVVNGSILTECLLDGMVRNHPTVEVAQTAFGRRLVAWAREHASRG